MKKGFLLSALVAFAGASFALAQTPNASPYGLISSEPAPKFSDQNVIPSQAVSVATSLSPEGVSIPEPIFADAAILDSGELRRADALPPNSFGGGGPNGRIWGSAEVLLWWIRGGATPPLVTTGPANSAQVPPPGSLGGSGTSILFGGRRDSDDPYFGGRLTLGGWLNRSQTFGLEGSYFFLGSRSNSFTNSSSGAPGSRVLARPFFDVSTGLPNSQLIAYPGLASGTVNVRSSTQFQGAAANVLFNLCRSCPNPCDPCQPAEGYQIDMITGVRYLNLREGLGIQENTQVLSTSPVLPGAMIRAYDQFNTSNQFYGGQIGLRAQVWRNRWFAIVTGTVALGDTHQSVDINGQTTFSPPLPGLGGRGAMLTLPSNIGHYSRDVFSIVPEVGLNIGYQVTNNLRVFAGYNFLYWSNVVRPGDAIDLRVNSSRTPGSIFPAAGPMSPTFAFRDSDFWAQGVSLGISMAW